MRILTILLLAGCTSMPAKEVYVVWQTPCSGQEAAIRRIKFVDTMTPTLDCLRAGNAEDTAKYILLTLMGMPITACALTDLKTNQAIIYAPISPSPTQIAVALGTLRPPEDLIQHEIGHAFGNGHYGCEE